MHFQVQCDSTTKPEIRSCNAETSTSPIRSPIISSSVSVNRNQNQNQRDGTDVCDGNNAENEQMLSQLRDLRVHQTRDQSRIIDLEDQVAALVQENHTLETQLLNASTRDEAMKSMRDELSTLDEVRYVFLKFKDLVNRSHYFNACVELICFVVFLLKARTIMSKMLKKR